MFFNQARNIRVAERFERNHLQRTPASPCKQQINPYFDSAFHQYISPPHFSANLQKKAANSHKKCINSFKESRQRAANQESFNQTFPSKFSQSINNTYLKAPSQTKYTNKQSVQIKNSPQKSKDHSYSKKKSHYLTVISRLPQFKSVSKAINFA